MEMDTKKQRDFLNTLFAAYVQQRTEDFDKLTAHLNQKTKAKAKAKAKVIQPLEKERVFGESQVDLPNISWCCG